MTDITLLTCRAYYKPDNATPYIQNILLEQELLKSALEAQGLKVDITYWDNPSYEWQQTKSVLFRTVWDYFERFDEFWEWLEQVKTKTRLINSYELIKWNIDKHYLRDLKNNGIQVVPTYFADRGNNISLQEIANLNDWKHIVIKPAISASAFNTYKIINDEIEQKEQLFHELLQTHDMLVQPFFPTISELGEASLMVFGGKFTHAILKKAKAGDEINLYANKIGIIAVGIYTGLSHFPTSIDELAPDWCINEKQIHLGIKWKILDKPKKYKPAPITLYEMN